MSSNTTPAPKAKTHSCSKCMRSFTTSKALHDHGLSTGHCIPCIKPGCKRNFSSEGALRDHLASSVHVSRKPVDQNEQTVKVKSPVPNRTNGTPSGRKQHACTVPGCQKSFKTLEARAQHLDSAFHAKSVAPTGSHKRENATPIVVAGSAKTSGSIEHNYVCTAPGCKRLFKTVEARTQHLGSAAHKRAVTATGPHERKDAKAIVAIASAQNAQFGYACTAPGCKRVFKTSQARAQHLDSAAHQKDVKATELPKREGIETTVVPNTSKTFTGFDQSTVSMQAAAPRKETLNAEKNTAGIPQVQTGETSASRGDTAKTQKSPQPTNSAKPEGPERMQVFRRDSRWSTIPELAHAETITALYSIPGATGLTSSIRETEMIVESENRLPPSYTDATNLKRRAIVLDCEMVGVGPKGSISTLARLSAIDFLTGELLIDHFVQPQQKVTDWRTKWSGITPTLIEKAKALGQVLEGTAAARKELLRHMDGKTILVGHALHHDLKALGIGHEVRVDSAVVAKAAVGTGVNKDWGLKVLCKELLGVTVQDHGKKGHDSVEDAMAARELVLWCLHHPKELGIWGAEKKKEVDAKKKQDAAKKRKKAELQKRSREEDLEYSYIADSDGWEYYNLNLREFNELCCYPSDYDNWSD